MAETKSLAADISKYTPTEGQFTFANEGNEGGPYHSRKLSVPSNSSGLTIGRGYDMKTKPAATIKTDLLNAGVDEAHASLISKAAGLNGEAARKFIKDNKLENFEITLEGQLKLFQTVFSEKKEYAKHLSSKEDVVKLYGKCEFEKIDKPIQELIVDMTFRGEYNGKARQKIQKAVNENNYDVLKVYFSDIKNFGNIDKNRFKARKDMLFKAFEMKQVEKSKK